MALGNSAGTVMNSKANLSTNVQLELNGVKGWSFMGKVWTITERGIQHLS